MGLGKLQEETRSNATSATAKESIKKIDDSSEEDIDTEIEDTSSGSSEPSTHSHESTRAFSKVHLLKFRPAAIEEDTGKEAETDIRFSLTAQCGLQIDSSSPRRSTPKSVDCVGSRSDVFSPTAGSWAAAMQTKRSTTSDENAEDEKVTRKACAILNKLTLEKFDSLFEQLATCGIRKPQHLEMLMREVFNKATTQHHFIAMYANLCVRLDQDSRIDIVDAERGEQRSFRKLLLDQCQMSFEKLLQSEETQQVSKDVEIDEEHALKRKQQALGNIKLIGQLLVHGIVTSKLLVECSEELLRCRDSCPEALESLAALLTVAGKQFDTPNWQYHSRLLEVFSCMRKLSKEKSTQARVRFLLRDVLDVRDAGWSHCTYKATLATAPMKLEDVRDSAANEGKYMSLEEHIETDNLLAGLMKVTQIANAKSEKLREEGRASQEGSFTHSRSSKGKPKKHPNGIRDAVSDGGRSLNKQKSGSQQSAPRAKNSESTPEAVFDVVSFRRALASILEDLASDKNVPAAVRRIRLQDVPVEFQAKEFSDIITRIMEERRGPIRRCALAFAVGLAAAEQSAFDRTACITGLKQFFDEVYAELCKEIQRLPAIVKSEFLPTLRNVFLEDELDRCLPGEFALPVPSA